MYVLPSTLSRMGSGAAGLGGAAGIGGAAEALADVDAGAFATFGPVRGVGVAAGQRLSAQRRHWLSSQPEMA